MNTRVIKRNFKIKEIKKGIKPEYESMKTGNYWHF